MCKSFQHSFFLFNLILNTQLKIVSLPGHFCIHFISVKTEMQNPAAFQRCFIVFFLQQILPKMPKNFSWVVDGFLAALGFPNEPANMMYLVKHGIKYLISLTAELTPSIKGFEGKLDVLTC